MCAIISRRGRADLTAERRSPIPTGIGDTSSRRYRTCSEVCGCGNRGIRQVRRGKTRITTAARLRNLVYLDPNKASNAMACLKGSGAARRRECTKRIDFCRSSKGLELGSWARAYKTRPATELVQCPFAGRQVTPTQFELSQRVNRRAPLHERPRLPTTLPSDWPHPNCCVAPQHVG